MEVQSIVQKPNLIGQMFSFGEFDYGCEIMNLFFKGNLPIKALEEDIEELIWMHVPAEEQRSKVIDENFEEVFGDLCDFQKSFDRIPKTLKGTENKKLVKAFDFTAEIYTTV